MEKLRKKLKTLAIIAVTAPVTLIAFASAPRARGFEVGDFFGEVGSGILAALSTGFSVIVYGINYLLALLVGLILRVGGFFINVAIIFIAFATITRRQTFGFKQLFAKLVMMALLINFSLVISGVIIDFTNVMSQFFIDKVASGG